MNIRKLNRTIPARYYFKAEEGDIGGDEDGDTGGAGGGDGAANTPAWSDAWRETYAGDDEAKLAKLSRYASPNAAFDAMIAAQTKISSGEYKSSSPFPDKGTPEEQTAWRNENGIPEAPDKYELNLGDGITIDDDEKPLIDSLFEKAHTANMSPKDAQVAVEWYHDIQEKQAEQQLEADELVRSSTEDTLRAEWGNEYRANVNRINGLLDTAPEGVKDNILNSRMPDGTPLANDPDALKFLIDLALQVNPATTLVPGAGDNINGAIADEIAAIEAEMSKPKGPGNLYYKGPMHANGLDTVMAVRYRELLQAQEKIKK